MIDAKQMALFAAFGSMALLVFADFGGSRRARLRAYLLLMVVGAVLIVLGTLCSRSTWLATIAMGLVAFAILFAGVLDDYVVAARAAVTLTFVLPVMVPADAAEIPTRLAGWGLAGALCIPAALLLWPARPRSALRREVAQAARSLAEPGRGHVPRRSRRRRHRGADTHTATVAVRGRFVSMTQRPSGTTGPTAALARLIEDLGWVLRVAERPPALASTAAPCPAERAEIETAAAAVLLGVAAHLEGGGSDLPLELARLREAHDVFGRAQLEHFEHMQPDRDEAEAEIELDEAYRLRALSYGVLQAGQDALQACEDRAKTISEQTLRTRIDTARRLVRTHASTRSVWLRNSLRWAVGLALAVLVGQLADLQNSFWIVLGTMSVLRSSALSTSATIASALLGTLAGIVLGGLIVVAVGGDHGVLWAVLPFAVLLAAYAPQAISFAAGQGAFTIVVLVLFNLIQPAGWRVGLVRVEDVAVGAAVSLLVGLLLWPRGATTILRGAIGAATMAPPATSTRRSQRCLATASRHTRASPPAKRSIPRSCSTRRCATISPTAAPRAGTSTISRCSRPAPVACAESPACSRTPTRSCVSRRSTTHCHGWPGHATRSTPNDRPAAGGTSRLGEQSLWRLLRQTLSPEVPVEKRLSPTDRSCSST